jgi:hypothetical protein
MKSIRLAAIVAAGLIWASPAAAQDNYLFGFSDSGTRQLELQTTSGLVVLNAVDSGWYFQDGSHTASNSNYIVGTCQSCGLVGSYNNYFTFNLGSVTGTITSATLSAYNPDYVSGVLSTWSLWDVTNPGLLDVTRASGNLTGQGIFTDFETGLLYGSLAVTGVSDGTLISVALNSNAITALNGGIGGQFAIGGTLREGNVIPGVSGVPEPGTWAMMLLGFGGIGYAMRRRRKSGATAQLASA